MVSKVVIVVFEVDVARVSMVLRVVSKVVIVSKVVSKVVVVSLEVPVALCSIVLRVVS